jgi:hypothetical protein
MDSPCSPSPGPVASKSSSWRADLAGLAVLAIWVGTCLQGCSPTWDWREVRPPGTRVQLLMPCKPNAHQRSVVVAGQSLRLTLLACSAGDITWALSSADVGDPARMGDTLQALLQSATQNLSAGRSSRQDLSVPGATPNAASQSASLEGRLPDGTQVLMQTAVFAHGTRAFQVTALGARLPQEPLQTFMASIRFAN